MVERLVCGLYIFGSVQTRSRCSSSTILPKILSSNLIFPLICGALLLINGFSKFNKPGFKPTVNGSKFQKLSRMILPTRRSYSMQLDVGPRAVLTVMDLPLLESETAGESLVCVCVCGAGAGGRERDAEVEAEAEGEVDVGIDGVGVVMLGRSLAGGNSEPDED
ncbi:hypothetical protein DL98DRAFT_514977 [Cadophora sp. DSE1049]|nr:hypothetical protein DL98DRAFT_514977 [Cadophora sp. DSE1049]